MQLSFNPPAMIQQVTGPNPGHAVQGNPLYTTNTYQYGMGAADLGCMWSGANGTTFHVFGDNYKTCTPAFAGPSGTDWQPNAIGRSSNVDLINGIRFDGFNVGSNGDRKPPLPLFTSTEDGLVPTGGVHANGIDYMAYVVFSKNHTSQTQTNAGGTAQSTDGGKTWTRNYGCYWNQNAGLTDPFQQSAFAYDGGAWVYRFTTQSARAGDIHLLRTPPTAVADKTQYQYWTGSAWVSDLTQVGVLIPGPAGEMSARYDDLLNVWYIMYHDDSAGTTVFQYATTPTGPWSDKLPIFPDSGRTPDGVYAPMIHPGSSGTDLYFCASDWNTYQTYLFYANLRVVG